MEQSECMESVALWECRFHISLRNPITLFECQITRFHGQSTHPVHLQPDEYLNGENEIRQSKNGADNIGLINCVAAHRRTISR